MQSDQAQQPDEDSPGAPRAQRWAWRSSIAIFSLRILVPLALIGAAIAFGAGSEPDTIPDVLSFDHLSRNHAMRPVNYAQSPRLVATITLSGRIVACMMLQYKTNLRCSP